MGHGRSRVYPEAKDFTHLIRNLKQHKRDLLLTAEKGVRVNGIIGSTPLDIIPGFD